MVPTSRFTALFLVIAALNTGVMAQVVGQISFHYRFYDNGGCNHSSPASDTFPPNNQDPLSGSSSECFSAPTGVNWNALELNNNLSNGNFELFTFCNVGCADFQTRSSAQGDTFCFAPPVDCAIGSFMVIPVNPNS